MTCLRQFLLGALCWLFFASAAHAQFEIENGMDAHAFSFSFALAPTVPAGTADTDAPPPNIAFVPPDPVTGRKAGPLTPGQTR